MPRKRFFLSYSLGNGSQTLQELIGFFFFSPFKKSLCLKDSLVESYLRKRKYTLVSIQTEAGKCEEGRTASNRRQWKRKDPQWSGKVHSAGQMATECICMVGGGSSMEERTAMASWTLTFRKENNKNHKYTK